MKDVFVWAYERSAARYAAVRQSLGEPDPFRLRHRLALREAVGAVVRGRLGRQAALAHLDTWARERIAAADQRQFAEVANAELLSLHEGNYARYQIRPSEFAAWQAAWTPPE